MKTSSCPIYLKSRPPLQTTSGTSAHITMRLAPTTANSKYRQDPEEAAKDFRDRIRNYEKVYQTIDESERGLTYVKIINVG